MKCMRCGKDSKWELCRECKEIKHKAGAMISQNKKKLKNLIEWNILEPEKFSKFILYTDNIRKRWEIYMSFMAKKHITIFKIITWATMTCSILLSLRSITSLIILHI